MQRSSLALGIETIVRQHYLAHISNTLASAASSAPQLTTTERTVVQLFDSSVVTKGEPGRASPPCPCDKNRSSTLRAAERLVKIKIENGMRAPSAEATVKSETLCILHPVRSKQLFDVSEKRFTTDAKHKHEQWPSCCFLGNHSLGDSLSFSLSLALSLSLSLPGRALILLVQLSLPPWMMRHLHSFPSH